MLEHDTYKEKANNKQYPRIHTCSFSDKGDKWVRPGTVKRLHKEEGKPDPLPM